MSTNIGTENASSPFPIIIYSSGNRFLVFSSEIVSYLRKELGIVGENSNTALQFQNNILKLNQKYNKEAKKLKQKKSNNNNTSNDNEAISDEIILTNSSSSDDDEESEYTGLPLVLSAQQVYALYHLQINKITQQFTLHIIAANSVSNIRQFTPNAEMCSNVTVRNDMINAELHIYNTAQQARIAYSAAMKQKFADQQGNKKGKNKKQKIEPRSIENQSNTEEVGAKENTEMIDIDSKNTDSKTELQNTISIQSTANVIAENRKKARLLAGLPKESSAYLAYSQHPLEADNLSLQTLYQHPIAMDTLEQYTKLEQQSIAELLYKAVCTRPCSPLLACVYSDLYQRGYWVTGGYQFGGHYLLYPGDPNNFHAGFIVVIMAWDEQQAHNEIQQNKHKKTTTSEYKTSSVTKMSALDMINISRLGTAVNKAIVLAGIKPVTKSVDTPDSSVIPILNASQKTMNNRQSVIKDHTDKKNPFNEFPFVNAEIVYHTFHWDQNLSNSKV